ncbi:hypothetical protein SAMN05421863_102827 [Nitrosomonas communis]|uniref:AlpA family phage regulatory protein n=1 Tax=Nitrosomonas communis TaxID=44574 RepID=A0A1I4QRX8_9PROT|nr:hypothetical protein SAMN05421863_102827 [Nitrosomonas communis]
MSVKITDTLKILKSTRSGHTQPKAPLVPLEQEGRLRVANWLALLGVCHSTFIKGVKSGRYPKPDGYDGRFPYWRNETARRFLIGESEGKNEN